MSSDGYMYEDKCILEWVKKANKLPLARQVINILKDCITCDE